MAVAASAPHTEAELNDSLMPLNALSLPVADNTPEALRSLLAANARFRTLPWPGPFDRTQHTLHLGDARDLAWVADESVHLVVTSPPYWTLKQYRPDQAGQLGDIEDYE